MISLLTLFRKELTDHFSSRRFIILLALVWLSGLSAIYVAGQSVPQEAEGAKFIFLKLFTTSSGAMPSFVAFVAFFGPIVGLALAFDAISRERASGTLSQVLAQPIYRDAVINGKFLAGLATIAFILVSILFIVGGLGLWLLGVPPSLEEVLRIIIYAVISLIYIGFWMALALLFSVFFKRITTSALAGIAIWLFFAFFISMIAGVAADRWAPIKEGITDSEIRHEQMITNVSRISPSTLYGEATISILEPTLQSLGPLASEEVSGLTPGPLPLGQSLLLVWPHLVALIGLTIVCFAISYTGFMKQEIRAP